MKILLGMILVAGICSQAHSASQDTCELLNYDIHQVHIETLAPSLVYVYSSLNRYSYCSGVIDSMRFCYKKSTELLNREMKEIGKFLILKRMTDSSLSVLAVIPLIVPTRECEDEEIVLSNNNVMCCDTRPIPLDLNLQASEGNLLNFTYGLITPNLFEGLSLVGFRDTRIKGIQFVVVRQYFVGSRIDPGILSNSTIAVGLVNFMAQVQPDTEDITITEMPKTTCKSNNGLIALSISLIFATISVPLTIVIIMLCLKQYYNRQRQVPNAVNSTNLQQHEYNKLNRKTQSTPQSTERKTTGSHTYEVVQLARDEDSGSMNSNPLYEAT